MKKLNYLLTLILLSGYAHTSLATSYSGTPSGQIDTIQASTTGNGGFPFVITLKNSPALCGTGSPTTAYLLNSDTNYRVNTSILLTAKSLGSTVYLYNNLDASGYCQIVAFSIQ